jgi:hypothetical protein
MYNEIPEPSYFQTPSDRLLASRQVLSTRGLTSMQVFESWILDARVWIGIAQGNFHSRYPWVRFIYLRLFQGLWLAIFLRVARGADLATVNPMVAQISAAHAAFQSIDQSINHNVWQLYGNAMHSHRYLRHLSARWRLRWGALSMCETTSTPLWT